MTIKLSDNSSFVISVNDVLWLSAGPVYFRANNATYTTADGSLKPSSSPAPASGNDTLGAYNKVVYTWSAGQQTVQTAVRYYNSLEAVIFSQVSFFTDVCFCFTSNQLNIYSAAVYGPLFKQIIIIFYFLCLFCNHYNLSSLRSVIVDICCHNHHHHLLQQQH